MPRIQCTKCNSEFFHLSVTITSVPTYVPAEKLYAYLFCSRCGTRRPDRIFLGTHYPKTRTKTTKKKHPAAKTLNHEVVRL